MARRNLVVWFETVCVVTSGDVRPTIGCHATAPAHRPPAPRTCGREVADGQVPTGTGPVICHFDTGLIVPDWVARGTNFNQVVPGGEFNLPGSVDVIPPGPWDADGLNWVGQPSQDFINGDCVGPPPTTDHRRRDRRPRRPRRPRGDDRRTDDHDDACRHDHDGRRVSDLGRASDNRARRSTTRGHVGGRRHRSRLDLHQPTASVAHGWNEPSLASLPGWCSLTPHGCHRQGTNGVHTDTILGGKEKAGTNEPRSATTSSGRPQAAPADAVKELGCVVTASHFDTEGGRDA